MVDGMAPFPMSRSLGVLVMASVNSAISATLQFDSDGQAMLERQLSLSAMLADCEELEPEERKVIRDLGLKYRGGGKWPMVETIAKLKIRPAASAGVGFRSLGVVLRTPARVVHVCTDCGGGVFGGGTGNRGSRRVGAGN